MNPISPAQLTEQLQWRYAVKKFDAQKKISPETWASLEQSLVLTPSSYGLQPWKFFVITSAEMKKKLRAVSWNQSQVEDCSHYVVLATRKVVTESDVDAYMKLISDTRGVATESLDGFRKVIVGDAVNGARSQWVTEWCARQAYIALGNLVASAALLGVDTCPMEGFSPEKYNVELNLADTPYQAIVSCALGYRSADDPLSKAKKVRFPAKDLITYI